MQLRRAFFAVPATSLAFITTLVTGNAADNREVWEPVPPVVNTVTVTDDLAGAVPADAIVLYDGTDLDAWHTAEGEQAANWEISEGVATVRRGLGTIKTRAAFGDIQLHVEWRPDAVIEGSSQSRGNSGIFLQSQYEVQILDSWDNPTYVNGQAGAVYLQHAPLVNAARPPGQWQSYDIIFKAPRFGADGSLVAPAYVTVLHNGVLVQNHAEIQGATYTPTPVYSVRCMPYGQSREQDCSAKMPLTLQDHGQVVSYRNIWVREL